MTMLLATGMLATAVQAQPSGPNLAGTWMGTLNVGMQLRLVFHVSADSSGGWTATLDSPDQGAMGIPMDAVVVNGDSVRLDLAAAMAHYEGVVAGPDTLDGKWVQSGRALPLLLGRTVGTPDYSRPQEPKPPFPYTAVEVTFENPRADSVTLAGTLTLPEGPGPFPAVVLVTGSGAQNRNEELLGHKPFLVLADHLTRTGIAVLRYDDRGVGGSTGHFAEATSEDFASDALSAVEFLASRDDIRPDAIGVAGHSEGGLIAPMVAAQSDQVGFIVLLAGTGMRGELILYDQGALILMANGATDEQIETNRVNQERLFHVVMNEPDPEAAAAELRPLMGERIDEMTPEELEQSGITPENRAQVIEQQISQINGAWFRYFLSFDPVDVLRKVKVPVLAINGSLDLQVPATANLAAIQAALQEAGNEHVTTVELEGLNHLFQTAVSGSPTEYSSIEETMSPRALGTISDWIVKTTGLDR